jgi:hypothetical protein
MKFPPALRRLLILGWVGGASLCEAGGDANLGRAATIRTN